MHDFITIYAYLIIATIAFALPIVLTLLSIFSDAISTVKRDAQEKETKYRLIILELTHKPNFDTDEITERSKVFEKQKNEIEKKLDLLSPKKQLRYVGLTLFLSLLFIFIDMVLRDNQWKISSHYGSIACILLSLFLFAISIIRMKDITWTLIESKIDVSQRFIEVEPLEIAQESPPNGED